MNKVYLLLRNNNVLGPFSIDELLQQHLKSTDMIWIEGRSVAWCYPSQIKELNNDFQKILSSVDKEEGNKESLSQSAQHLPELSFEQRVEAIRKKALAYSYKELIARKPIAEAQSSSAYVNQKETVNLVYHSSKKYVTLGQLIASGAVTAIVAWVWYSGWTPINPKVASEQAAVVPVNMVTVQDNAAKQTVIADTVATVIVDSSQIKPVFAGLVTKKQSAAIDTGSTASTITDDPTENPTAQTEVAAPIEEPVKKETSTNVVAKTEEKKDVKPEELKEISTAEPEKKKTLGQAIKGIFKKKKKDKEELVNE